MPEMTLDSGLIGVNRVALSGLSSVTRKTARYKSIFRRNSFAPCLPTRNGFDLKNTSQTAVNGKIGSGLCVGNACRQKSGPAYCGCLESHSLANRCASAIWLGFICLATSSRSFATFGNPSPLVAKLTQTDAFTRSRCTHLPSAFIIAGASCYALSNSSTFAFTIEMANRSP